MKTIIGFHLRSFLLAAFFAGLGFGSHATADPFHRAYLIDLNSRTATDLGTLGGSSYAFGINDAGQVVGYADLYAVPPTIEVSSRAFITGPDGVGMRDLGTLGGRSSIAYDINEAGQVIGVANTSFGKAPAFITGPDGTGMRDLGTFGGASNIAYGINNTGQVVGSFDPPIDFSRHVFITGPDGMGIRDLGTLGGRTGTARGINDAGQVVGWSKTITGGEHAFITGPDGTGMRDSHARRRFQFCLGHQRCGTGGGRVSVDGRV